MASLGSVDLHVHSVFSDGLWTPSDLVRDAQTRGVRHMALTDHDCTDGLEDAMAAGRAHGVDVIPGVELSTESPDGEIHILGYFPEPSSPSCPGYQSPELQGLLAQLRETRHGRGQAMVERLRAMGMEITWERVEELAGEGSVGRPHVAQVLLEKGYIGSVAEAFDRYIGRGGPAYVERIKLTPEEAVGLIRSCGGVSSLAHPLDLGDVPGAVARLAAMGLTGLESYYNRYTPDQVEMLVALAQRHHLLPTGGSDFHGFPMSGAAEVSNWIGSVWVPEDTVDRLRALAEKAATRS